MPLKEGSSDETFSTNVREMMKAGHSQEQAVAAAYRQRREAKRKETAKDGAPVFDGGHMWTRGLPMSDTAVFDGVEATADGYLKGWAKVARVGTQKYRGFEVGMPARDHVVLYRPAEEVFATAALASMANKPITLTHPKKMVDAKTWSKVAKGFSGNEVVRDGDVVRIPLMLTDAEAIDAYKSGAAKEMSVGYLTDIDWVQGATPQGEAYDGIQRSIRCNHHALVPVARGGRSLRFGDAWSPEARQAALEARRSQAQEYIGSLKGPVANYANAYHTWLHSGGATPPQGTGPAYQEARTTLHGIYMDAWDDPDDDTGMECPNCGESLTGSPITCPSCGFDLRPVQRSMGNDAMTCKDCGGSMSMKDGKYVCDDCGKTAVRDAGFMRRQAASYLLEDRDWSQKERDEAEKQGHAMAGGKFPIENAADVRAAVHLVGRGNASEGSVKAFIKRRAKEIGAESELPDDWKTSSGNDADVFGNHGEESMPVIMKIAGVPVSFVDDSGAAYVTKLLADQQRRLADAEGDPDAKVKEEQDREKKERGMKDALAAKDGEIAVLKKQLTDSQVSDADLDARLAQRSAVIDQAKPFLPASFKPEGQSLSAIRKAVVVNAMGDSAVKDWDDAAIGGAFLAIARGAKPGQTGASRMAAGMGDALRVTDSQGWLNNAGGGGGGSDPRAVADAAYEEMIKERQGAYKKPVGYAPN